MKKPILHLNLSAKWYDMISILIKKEEYREIKPYWNRIFADNGKIKIKGRYYHPTDVIVCFSNGYTKDRRQMFWTLKGLKVTFGRLDWGAKEDVQYHTLILNNKILPEEIYWQEIDVYCQNKKFDTILQLYIRPIDKKTIQKAAKSIEKRISILQRKHLK